MSIITSDRTKTGIAIVLCMIAFGLMHVANQDVGYLFGWLIGASITPVGATAMPLIFGLLSVIIFASVSKIFSASASARQVNEGKVAKLIVPAIAACFLLHFTAWFVFHIRVGIADGQEVLSGHREKIEVTANLQGTKAYLAGVRVESNPYENKAIYRERAMWLDGWISESSKSDD